MRLLAVVMIGIIGGGGCKVERQDRGGAPGSESSATDSLQQQVRAELERYYTDFSARDWTRFADHFWPGATLTTVWQPPGTAAPIVDAQTVPAFVAKAPQGPGSKPIFEERMTGAEVRVHRNLAQAWARYKARFGDSTNVMEWQGIDAITLMEHQGRWRIVALAFTDLAGEPTDRGSSPERR